MPIIQPNAVITLGAALPSDPEKMASIALPLDPSVQGMPPVIDGISPQAQQTLGMGLWIYMRVLHEMRARIDRLERLVAVLAPEPITGLGGMASPEMREAYALGAQLRKEVGARRELEAKAAAEREAAGGVQ